MVRVALDLDISARFTVKDNIPILRVKVTSAQGVDACRDIRIDELFDHRLEYSVAMAIGSIEGYLHDWGGLNYKTPWTENN
jgi:hypothetical protein